LYREIIRKREASNLECRLSFVYRSNTERVYTRVRLPICRAGSLLEIESAQRGYANKGQASNLEGKLSFVYRINTESLYERKMPPICKAGRFLHIESIQRGPTKERGLRCGGQVLFCI